MVRHAWQSWRHAKSVALLAILAFAVGIGATTALFTVINGVVFRPISYAEADRFVTLFGADAGEPGRYSSSTLTDLLEYQQQTTSFDAFGWFRLANVNLTSPGEPQYLSGVAVTPSLVHSLGVTPRLGQWFSGEEGVVIADSLWRRLGRDASIVGSAVTIDGRPYTVTGVMPRGFRLPATGTVPTHVEAEIWIPLDPLGREANPGQGIYFAYARRKPGVSLEQAQADAARVAAGIAARDPVARRSYTAAVIDLRQGAFTELRSTLLLLLGAGGLLLVVACANVATLLLARSVARSRETAVRVALGEPQRHLAARSIVEGLLVGLAGGAAGITFSIVLTRAIVTVGSAYIPYADEIALDWRVLAFACVVAVVASTLASLAPVWQALRTPPAAVLTEGLRASSGARARRVTQALVVAEMAVAFTLLAVSIVIVTHVRRLDRVPTGFEPDGLITFQLAAPEPVMASLDRWPYQRRIVEAVQQVPGVTAAAFANQLPVDGGCCLGGTVHVQSAPPGAETRRASFMFITPDYFSAMGIPLRAGRFLTEADTSDDFLMAIVNETAARRYWPDRDPVGLSGRLNRADGALFQVIGVAGDVRNDGPNNPPEAEIYLLASLAPVNPMEMVVRSTLPPEQVIPALRRAIGQADPGLAMHDIRTVPEMIRDSVQLERVSSLLMIGFAAAALLMATLGVYGVIAYAVRQRTVEVGTRMALGAVSRDILGLMVGNGLRMAAAGVLAGAFAVAGSVWIAARLLEISEIGWLPFASSIGVVATVAAAASYVPAWRATQLSPLSALRGEQAAAWDLDRLRRTVRGVRQALVREPEGAVLSATELLGAFVATARSAESFAVALQASLEILRERLGAGTAELLERHADGDYRTRIVLGEREPVAGLPADGFLVRRLRAQRFPLSISAGELETAAEWAAAHRPERLGELRRLRAADVRLAVPLRTKHEIMGVLLLGPPAGRQRYHRSDREVVHACADQFALLIENARLTERLIEQEKLRRDVRLAAEVQQGFLPDAPPVSDAAEFAAMSVPARTIGGDYYDFLRSGDRQIAIALADVSGKGVSAALIMAALQASLRILSSETGVQPAQLVERLNDCLYRTTPASKYATLFYARLEQDGRRLRYVNAGHNPPYLARMPASSSESPERTIAIEELAAGGTVVGMFPEMAYDEGVVELEPGDVLLVFTDGVPEAQNADRVEFGEDRVKALLCASAHLPAAAICEHLAGELRQWIGDAEQADDLTLVVLKAR